MNGVFDEFLRNLKDCLHEHHILELGSEDICLAGEFNQDSTKSDRQSRNLQELEDYAFV